MEQEFISISGKHLKYLQYIPEKEEKLPLVLYIHGAGSRGKDLERLKENPALCRILEHAGKTAVVVAPLCHVNTWFELFESLLEFVEFQIHQPNVDAARVYVTGASMGGYTTWQLCMSRPSWFAAAVPVCGGGMYWNADQLKDLPIWAFHGVQDTVVYAEESIKMVKAINQYGGNAKLTVFSQDSHDSWTNAYNTKELWTWLFEQKRSV